MENTSLDYQLEPLQTICEKMGTVRDKKGKILIGDYEAAFDFENGQIFIKKNPTLVNLYHEGYHAEQWLDIGNEMMLI